MWVTVLCHRRYVAESGGYRAVAGVGRGGGGVHVALVLFPTDCSLAFFSRPVILQEHF